MDRDAHDQNLPLALAITGASGAPYWIRFLELALRAGREVHLVASSNVETVCRAETGKGLEETLENIRIDTKSEQRIQVYDRTDFYSPMASGSARIAAMIVLPCSMGTLARIANGTSDDLITRAADVCLKERRKLVLVPRETPLSLIHLENMTAVTRAGAVVLPAMPGFYNQPKDIGDLVDFVVQRIADQVGLDLDLVKRWGE